MIGIKVQVSDGASPLLRQVIGSLTGAEAAELNEIGGRAAAQAAAAYHRAYDQGGGWRRGGGSWSRFGGDVTAGWHFRTADGAGAMIANDADHYGHKVRGGTIRAKRVRFLTIPMVPEAKGLRVETYIQNTGRKLFRIRGKKALFEQTEAGGKRGVRAVYALVQQVTQGPWLGALPPEEELSQAFSKAWRDELADRIERLTQ